MDRREGVGMKTVAVDLDATLATYEGWRGIQHIGDPRPGAANFLRRLREVSRVVVFTTRCKEYPPGTGTERGHEPDRSTVEVLAGHVTGWLDRHELPYDEVYTGQGKPVFAAIVDDRAVPIPPNPSEADFERALVEVHRLLVRK
jgi:hypothetical protein